MFCLTHRCTAFDGEDYRYISPTLLQHASIVCEDTHCSFVFIQEAIQERSIAMVGLCITMMMGIGIATSSIIGRAQLLGYLWTHFGVWWPTI